MNIAIVCEGEHTTVPVLGVLELPDGTPPAVVAAAQAGHLCEDCGFAWTQLTGQFQQGNPGLPPRSKIRAADVDAVLQQHGKGRAKPR